MADIFISYASEDRSKAQQFADALKAQGWSVWWDRAIPAGSTFAEVIDEALADARCVVVMWTARSVTKNWVLEEAEDGLERDILVPIFAEEVKPPRGFRRIQAADLAQWDGTDTSVAFQQLVTDVARILGPPPVEERRKAEEQRRLARELEEKQRAKEQGERQRAALEAQEVAELKAKQEAQREKDAAEAKRKEEEHPRRKLVEAKAGHVTEAGQADRSQSEPDRHVQQDGQSSPDDSIVKRCDLIWLGFTVVGIVLAQGMPSWLGIGPQTVFLYLHHASMLTILCSASIVAVVQLVPLRAAIMRAAVDFAVPLWTQAIWAGSCFVGWAVGLFLGRMVILGHPPSSFNSPQIYTDWNAQAVALLGLCVGIGQWLILRRYLASAWWWIVFTEVGFLLAYFAVWISPDVVSFGWSRSAFGAQSLLFALTLGGITGVGLRWLSTASIGALR